MPRLNSRAHAEGEMISRRGFLRRMVVGATAATGLDLLGIFQKKVHAQQAVTRKALITLFLSGGPCGNDTFNPHPPTAPDVFRGPFRSIPTRTPGVRFTEIFPMLAERSNQFALVRSLNANTGDHIAGARNAMMKASRNVSEIVGGPAASTVPYVFLNPNSAWPATQSVFHQGMAFSPIYRNREFFPPPAAAMTNIDERLDLLHAFDTSPIASPVAQQMDDFRRTAIDLSRHGGPFFSAFNLPERDVSRYGNSLAGRGLLLARQLVNRGAGSVTLYHEPDPAAWDTHRNLEAELRRLSPEVDRAAAALIDDMQNDVVECVFLITAEFSRTPNMIDGGGTGRAHWGQGNCAILAGERVRAGYVHGRTNMHGHIVDGEVQQAIALPNTVIMACGGEVSPAEPKIRELLRS